MPQRGKRRQSVIPSAQSVPPTIDINEGPRVAQALRLRRLGWGYEAIAHECGYKEESGARKAIKKANARIIRDEATALVGWQLDMLDAALQIVMKRIAADTPESLWAVDRLTPLLKHQADLMKLYPTDAAASALPVVREYPAGATEAV